MLAQCAAVVMPVEAPALLQDRHHAIDEGVDPTVIDVGRHPKPIGRPGFKPFLHVIVSFDSGADDYRMIVDQAMRQHIAQGPFLTRDGQGIRRAGILPAAHRTIGPHAPQRATWP
jgi:hypothetical protein